MSKKHNQKLITPEILRQAVIGSFQKLNPRYMMKNPVMFVVEVGCAITLVLSFFPNVFGDLAQSNLRTYNIIVCVILFITVLFANFAESVAEGRGKAQAASLKKTQKETKARLLKEDGTEEVVLSNELKKGDVVMVSAGEIIPGDGEVIEGIASVDESAITGESAPVVRESGGDFCSVTGGTTVVSDWLKVKITSDPGNSFLDRMIALVEGASRKKTPNEIALNTLLVSLTIIFMIVIVTLYPIGIYSGVQLQTSTLIALAVCLIPTTIGGLLSAIGIAGMDRVTRFNVIAMSGKAVEACGDVDTMILDKTGTITYGNRLAADFFPVGGANRSDLVRCAALTSLRDETPEGKSTVELARRMGDNSQEIDGSCFIEFTAQTRMSGVDLPDGTKIRKGAAEAIEQYVKELGGKIPEDLHDQVNKISSLGGTPLTVCENDRILGVIYLKDTVKPGMVERFERLRAIGIKTIMCTGDNPLTAATIAKEAGVDGFIAECKPEDKIDVIKKEQAEGKIVAMTGDGTNDAPALAQADVAIVNTCGFIDAAKQEAIDTILETAQWKQQGQLKALIATGCLVERYQDEILQELPELDSVQTEGAAQPLFDRTEHMPVKVGEADTLDATEPDFAPRLAKAITEAEQEGARHVELKLAPEHLGRLSVELTQGKDGVLHIVFHAENEQAMKLLQEHSATLVSMLHGSHSGEIQVEVPRPQQGEQPWQQPEQQPGQQHGRNPQEQGRQRQSTEDFLQQLRLGLLGVEAE